MRQGKGEEGGEGALFTVFGLSSDCTPSLSKTLTWLQPSVFHLSILGRLSEHGHGGSTTQEQDLPAKAGSKKLLKIPKCIKPSRLGDNPSPPVSACVYIMSPNLYDRTGEERGESRIYEREFGGSVAEAACLHHSCSKTLDCD